MRPREGKGHLRVTPQSGAVGRWSCQSWVPAHVLQLQVQCGGRKEENGGREVGGRTETGGKTKEGGRKEGR